MSFMTFEDFQAKVRSWSAALKNRETRVLAFIGLFIGLLVLGFDFALPFLAKPVEPQAPTAATSSPSSTPLLVNEPPSLPRSSELPPACTAVLHATRDYNLSDGTHQREAWGLLEAALRSWPTDLPLVDRTRLGHARELWQQGKFGSAVEQFAAAYPCQ